MKAKFKLGQLVKMTDNAAEHYEVNKIDNLFIIDFISKNINDHPGYNEGVNQPLYDLLVASTEDDYPNSLYEYELEAVNN